MGITQAQPDPQGFLTKLDVALANGLKLIQIREKDMPAAEFHAFAHEVTQRAHAQQAYTIINSDIALAQAIGADGVQLTASQLNQLDTRPDLLWVGASCHNADELDRAEQLGCDYALLSPVLPTASHPGAPTLGWDEFTRLSQQRSLAILALGGLRPADLMTAQQHGAHGIALLRGAW
jgi:8-oxo-dGTP diphosphatase